MEHSQWVVEISRGQFVCKLGGGGSLAVPARSVSDYVNYPGVSAADTDLHMMSR